ATYPTPQSAAVFATRVREGLRGIPGVEDAGVVNLPPLVGGGRMIDDFHLEREAEGTKGYPVSLFTTSPDYFSAMSIGIIHGRDFAASDDASSLPVMIISASVARKYWPPDGAA